MNRFKKWFNDKQNQSQNRYFMKIIKYSSIMAYIGVMILFFTPAVHASFWGLFEETNETAKEILLRYDDYLTRGNMFLFVFRSLGWGLIWLLNKGVEIFSSATLDIVNIGNFFNDDGFQEIFSLFDELRYFLLLLALLTMFTLMIFGRKVEFSQSLANLMLSMIIVMALPSFVDTALGLTQDYSKELNEHNGISIGEKVIKDNVYDLAVFAKNDWIDPDEIKEKNESPDSKYISINQQVTNPDEFKGDGVLGYYLDTVDGEIVAAKFDPDVGYGKRWLQDMIGAGYYRWHVNFLTIIFTLATLNFVYIYGGVRMGRFMIELGYNQGFATILAFADFRTMNRLKSVLFQIVATLCTIVAMFASFSIFASFTNYIVESNLTGASYLFALLGAMWFVVDGPVMIQKVLGIDAGVQSAWSVLGGFMGAKSVFKGAGKLMEAAKPIVSKAAQAGAFVAGATAGGLHNAAQGINEKLKDMKGNKNGDEENYSKLQGLNEEKEGSDSENDSKGINEGKERNDSGNDSKGINEGKEENELEDGSKDINEGKDGIGIGDESKGINEGRGEKASENGVKGINEGREGKTSEDGPKGINEDREEKASEDGSKGINESREEKTSEDGPKGINESGEEKTSEDGPKGINEGKEEKLSEGGSKGINEGKEEKVSGNSSNGINGGKEEKVSGNSSNGINKGKEEKVLGNDSNVTNGGNKGIGSDGNSRSINEGQKEGPKDNSTQNGLNNGGPVQPQDDTQYPLKPIKRVHNPIKETEIGKSFIKGYKATK